METNKLKEIMNLSKPEKLNLLKTLCENIIDEHQKDLSEKQIRDIKDRLEEAEILLLDYR